MNQQSPVPNTRTPLPEGFLLYGKYRIQKVLGTGGFGITYLASIMNLPDSSPSVETFVAVKEYFPSGISIRKQEDGSHDIIAVSEEKNFYFKKGYERIRKEGEIIRHFHDLKSIVSLYDIFAANQTVYLVMEYIDGITLQHYITEQGILTFHEVFSLFTPVIKDLISIHKEGLIHCDITPDNLIISTENILRLIDFGSFGDKTIPQKEKTVILRTGYAPPEQYLPNGKIGPWTDGYAICATICFALSGIPPSDAIQRENQDVPSCLKQIPDLENDLKRVLQKGLMLQISDRYSDLTELYSALSGEPADTGQNTEFAFPQTELDAKISPGIKRKSRMIYVFLVLFSIALLFSIIYANSRSALKNPEKVRTATKVVTMPPAAVPSIQTAVSPSPVEFFTMPDLSRMTKKQAKKKIADLHAGITIKISYKYSETEKKGTILSQSIPKDTSFTEGQINTLLLTVSLGKQKKVPATKAPATKAPATKAPATKAPATKKPASKSSSRQKQNNDSFSFSTKKPYSSFTLE